MPGDLGVVALGRMPYGEALTLQRDLAARRIAGDLPRDLLVLVEHPPVITLGRGFQPRHLPAAPEFLAARGVEVHEVERGGDVTFHGPGQLVGYPIFDLKQHRQDLHWFLRQLEEALIRALGELGIAGRARRGLHRRLDAEPQDREHRHPRPPVGHLARLRAQRDHRPVLLRSHRPVRHPGRADDQRAARARDPVPAGWMEPGPWTT
jgi:hypothetical protein